MTAQDSKTERATILSNVLQYWPLYLNSYENDGFASEGVSYYNYGYSRLFLLREIILIHTQDKIDIFSRDARARMAAYFLPKFEIYPATSAQFGDSRAESNDIGLRALLKNYLMGVMLSIDDARQTDQLELILIHYKLHMQPAGRVSDPYLIRDYFNISQVYIGRPLVPGNGTAVTFKVLGNGKNAGHSHNDIGSYVIFNNRTIVSGDPGGPAYYDGSSFGPTRYNSPLMNSYGHPVPVIATKLQSNAITVSTSTIRPSVQSTSFTTAIDQLTINLAPAYNVSTLKKLQRNFLLNRNVSRVKVTDKVEYSKAEFFETAVTSSLANFTRLSTTTALFSDDKIAQKLYLRFAYSIFSNNPLNVTVKQVDAYGVKFWRLGLIFAKPILAGNISVEYCLNRPC